MAYARLAISGAALINGDNRVLEEQVRRLRKRVSGECVIVVRPAFSEDERYRDGDAVYVLALSDDKLVEYVVRAVRAVAQIESAEIEKLRSELRRHEQLRAAQRAAAEFLEAAQYGVGYPGGIDAKADALMRALEARADG